MRKLLLAGVLLALPISALGMSFAGPASASVNAKQPGVTCTKIKANIAGTKAKLKDCSDLQNTGGKGKTTIAALATGTGTITWNGTGTTTLDNGTFTQEMTSTCPIDPATGQPETEYDVTLDVSGGTGKALKSIPAGWTMEAMVCVDSTGNVTLLPGTDVNIGAAF